MGGNVRNATVVRSGSKAVGVFGLVAVSAILAGCSTDVSRFDYPAFGLTSQNPKPRLPIPTEPVYDNSALPAAASPYQQQAAPQPDYGGYGDNSGAPAAGNGYAPKYAYRSPAPQAPAFAGQPNSYAAPGSNAFGSMPPAGNGFGTVSGQPESYKTANLAPGGRTSYVTDATSGAQGPNFASATPRAAVPALSGPAILAPVPDARLMPRMRRPKEGTVVEVLPGETLTQVARRNGVSVAALMQINHLRSPVVATGQQLIMPGKGGRSILAPAGAPASVALAGPALMAAAPVTQPAKTSALAMPAQTSIGPVEGDNPDGTYTVRAGDSIYSIARKHGVRPEDIAAVNGITDVTKVKFGQALKMPGNRSAVRPLASASPGLKPLASLNRRVASLQGAALSPVAPASDMMTDASGMDADGIPDTTAMDDPAASPATSAAPARLPPMKAMAGAKSPIKVAALPAATDPAAAKPTTTDMATDGPSDGRFRWPVRGRIIGKFGPGAKGGAQNEGIDLAVPMGTEVHAAENGVVAYSGDELKGYGKLVLIRHADNWVSAYAHNDELLVKRGDTIRRGQIIAKAGKTGGVDQPLLHFELRKGSQPVDPMPHMASN